MQKIPSDKVNGFIVVCNIYLKINVPGVMFYGSGNAVRKSLLTFASWRKEGRSPDSEVRLEVRLEDETVWLTQAQIVELFQSSKANISEHIKNIYEQGELDESSTVRDFRTVRQEGRRYVERVLTYYNLDAIISIGFRVNSKRGIQFPSTSVSVIWKIG